MGIHLDVMGDRSSGRLRPGARAIDVDRLPQKMVYYTIFVHMNTISLNYSSLMHETVNVNNCRKSLHQMVASICQTSTDTARLVEGG